MAVTFKIYQSNGSTLVCTLPTVFSANYPHTEKNLIEHSNVRGKGSIVIDGGDSAWDLSIRGVLFAADYDALMALVDTLESNIALNTPFYLKITKSVGGATTYDYKVKRITPIEYETDNLRTSYIEYQITLRVNAW